MKYDVTKEIRSFDGKTVMLQDGEAPRAMTLRDAIKAVCLNAGDQAKGLDDKLRLYEILERVHNAESVANLSAEEVAQLKRIGGLLFTVTLVGPFVKLLETPGA